MKNSDDFDRRRHVESSVARGGKGWEYAVNTFA